MKVLDEWITGDELLERWGIGKAELFRRVQFGLPAYRSCDALEPSITADKFRKIGIDTKGFVFKPDYTDKQGNHFSRAYLELPEGINEIPSLFFKLEDIELWKPEDKSEPIKETEPGKILPCDPETRWQDIKRTLTSHETVTIKTPEGSRRYHFSELDMKDGRKGDTPTRLWELLKYFCEYSGRISSETSVDRIFSLRFRNLSKNISDLNKKLQKVFGINESFCHGYDPENGWVAKCVFSDKTEF